MTDYSVNSTIATGTTIQITSTTTLTEDPPFLITGESESVSNVITDNYMYQLYIVTSSKSSAVPMISETPASSTLINKVSFKGQ